MTPEREPRSHGTLLFQIESIHRHKIERAEEATGYADARARFDAQRKTLFAERHYIEREVLAALSRGAIQEAVELIDQYDDRPLSPPVEEGCVPSNGQQPTVNGQRSTVNG